MSGLGGLEPCYYSCISIPDLSHAGSISGVMFIHFVEREHIPLGSEWALNWLHGKNMAPWWWHLNWNYRSGRQTRAKMNPDPVWVVLCSVFSQEIAIYPFDIELGSDTMCWGGIIGQTL
eukprot:scaffold1336_cov158-Cylindrotheca_fusiformis.AAC.10